MAEFLAQNRFLIPRATNTAALSSTKIHPWTRQYKQTFRTNGSRKIAIGPTARVENRKHPALSNLQDVQCCPANSTPAARRKSLNILALNGFLEVKLLYQTPADVSQTSQLMIPGTPRTCGRVWIYLRPGIHGTNTKRKKVEKTCMFLGRSSR